MKIKTLKHTESLDDLVQLSDSDAQMLDEAILARTDELISELNILEDDIIEYSSTIEVKITIKYKKTGQTLNSI